jgi:predicted ABC-type ATPase
VVFWWWKGHFDLIMKNKKVYIIAGPNGSGKTTFAKKFLPNYAKCQNFVNADLIAQGLSPFSPRTAAMRAGRLVLEQIHSLAEKNCDFAFETTLSGKSYVSFLNILKEKGYAINLFFLWIPSTELALARIKERVSEGGHDVPAVDVKRRFHRGICNFFKYYKPIADNWLLFNNAGIVPSLIAREKEGNAEIIDKNLFEKIAKTVR